MTHIEARASKLKKGLAVLQATVLMVGIVTLSLPMPAFAITTDNDDGPHFDKTLIVKKVVVGGTAVPDDFSVQVSDHNFFLPLNADVVTNHAFVNGEVEIAGSYFHSYTVTEPNPGTGYTPSYSNCSISFFDVLFNGSQTCTVTNTFQGDQEVPVDPPSCNLVSDETTMVGENPAVVTAPTVSVSGPWTHDLDATGAQWIWNAALATPSDDTDEVVTFTKTFNVVGTPSSVVLNLAADNYYSVKVNSDDAVCADTSNLDNFSNVEAPCDITTHVHPGVNTLTFTVTNKSGFGTDPQANPGGLIYSVDITGASCGDLPPPTPPNTLKVHILKYLKSGQTEVPASGELPAFPMHSSWSATNIGTSEGDYTLNSAGFGGAGAYAADTSAMSIPADYSTHEVPNGDNVLASDATCHPGAYRLVGYQTGDSLNAALTGAAPSLTVPTFSGLTADKYVVVVNEACPQVVDQCSNISGVQETVPAGMNTNSDHICSPANTCVMPSVGENDADHVDTFGTSAPELTIQQVLDAAFGAGVVNADTAQHNYQYWAGSGNTVHFSAKALAHLSGYTHVFGYYTNGNLSTFVPVFRDGTVPGIDNLLPQKDVAGDGSVAFTVAPVNASGVGFAIKAFDGSLNPVGTYATHNFLNGGQQRDVSYNPTGNEYVMGWDDQATNPDGDYQDLVVDLSVTGCEDAVTCNSDQNLLANGSFELPSVAAGDWDLFNTGAPGLGWVVNWLNPGGKPANANIEIQHGLGGWLASAGSQWAELDSDWAKNNTGNPAGTDISQDVTTVPGQTYTFAFDSSPRPGTAASDNAMLALVDGTPVVTVPPGTTPANATQWTSHSYSFVAANTTTHIELKDNGATENSFGALVDNASLRCTPTNNQPVVTVTASKIVCDNESMLPNWGNGGPDITSSTATAWVAQHEGCHLVSGWSFDWGNSSQGDGGNATLGHVAGYTAFGPTAGDGTVTTNIPLSSLNEDHTIHLREQLQSGFIPFTYNGSNENNVSAEFYCSTDVLNYDNLDYISGAVAGAHYYCVAFNAPTPGGDEGGSTGTLEIVKNAAGGNGTFDFSVSDHADVQVTTNDGQGFVDTSLPAGNYDVSENVPGGWDLNSLSCKDGETIVGSALEDNENGLNINIPAGHTIVCTFNNEVAEVTPNGHHTPQIQTGGGGGDGSDGGVTNDGSVLGESTSTPETCEPLLHNFLKLGWKNDTDEVKKLQQFLADQLGINLPVTGFFGPATFNAVKAFQKSEWEKVLKPWITIPGSGISGQNTPTGFVYQTTKWDINNISCPGSEAFPDTLN